MSHRQLGRRRGPLPRSRRRKDPPVVTTLTPARLAKLGAMCVVVSALLVGALHVLPGSRALNPLSRTISEYALLTDGWVFGLGVVILAVGSGLILQALVLTGRLRWRTPAGVFAVAWCAGLVGLVAFPKQGFGPDTTVLGRIHWSWTLLAFVSLPIAVALICRGRAGGPVRGLRVLTGVAGGWFAVLTVQTVPGATELVPIGQLVGLVERGVAVTEMAMTLVLAWWVAAAQRVVAPAANVRV